jgi:hypothetical protein
LASLYRDNAPARFWRVLAEPEPAAADWATAVRAAALELPEAARHGGDDIDSLLAQTLGEEQFGPSHWRLGPATRLYYRLKPLLPRALTRQLRRAQVSLPFRGKANKAALPLMGRAGRGQAPTLGWPIEVRYPRFQWEIMRQLLRLTGRSALPFIHFWPHGRPYAFVLTHDVETADGQAWVRKVADLDARYGFRSSFNFVPERYRLDRALIEELRQRGFEIGVHGLNHDGRLFSSKALFMRRAAQINRHLTDLGAVGFRSPLTHRQPEWMQALEIDYDLSFFDTDPYEPMAGGTMSLWPFTIGRFLELPYTLAQDYTLTAVLGETTPRLWLQKVDVIRAYSGLALVNTHPDYLRNPATLKIYEDFLRTMRERDDYWHALPRDTAAWWRARAVAPSTVSLSGAVRATFRSSGAEIPSDHVRYALDVLQR